MHVLVIRYEDNPEKILAVVRVPDGQSEAATLRWWCEQSELELGVTDVTTTSMNLIDPLTE